MRFSNDVFEVNDQWKYYRDCSLKKTGIVSLEYHFNGVIDLQFGHGVRMDKGGPLAMCKPNWKVDRRFVVKTLSELGELLNAMVIRQDGRLGDSPLSLLG